MTTILICGDREWADMITMRQIINSFPPDTVIVEGEARGADKMARQLAENRGLIVLKFPADWKRYGRAAGPVRNREMLTKGKPDRVIAFHKDITRSKGTLDMMRVAHKSKIPVTLISAMGDDPNALWSPF